MEYVWVGYFCFLMNGVFVMCEIENGVYLVCVQNGLGIVCGMLIGIGVVELVCGVILDIIKYFMLEDCLSCLLFQFFCQIGVNVVLCW